MPTFPVGSSVPENKVLSHLIGPKLRGRRSLQRIVEVPLHRMAEPGSTESLNYERRHRGRRSPEDMAAGGAGPDLRDPASASLRGTNILRDTSGPESTRQLRRTRIPRGTAPSLFLSSRGRSDPSDIAYNSTALPEVGTSPERTHGGKCSRHRDTCGLAAR